MVEETGRRFSDEMLIRMDQKFEDHLEFSKQRSEMFEARIIDLERFRTNIEKPVHAAGWLLIGLVGSFVAAIGTYAWRLLTRVHFGQ